MITRVIRVLGIVASIAACTGCSSGGNENASNPATDAAVGTNIARADVVVYGATPGGITAAVAAARAGRSVVLVEPTAWIGGMMTAGLSRTDIGPRGPEVFGGLTAEFFRRTREIAQARGVCIESCEQSYDFEPHVAEQVFEAMVGEAGVVLERSARITDVDKNGTTIVRISTSSGDFAADVFIDASYEGDLMALAGVPYRLGREPRGVAAANDVTGLAEQEDWAGTQPYRLPLGVHIDPYRTPGDPSSGTIAFVDPRPERLPTPGEGDSRVMAYTYRLCVTDDPANRIPFARPEGFDPADYEVHARLALAAPPNVSTARAMFNPSPIALSRDPRYRKYDLNGGFTLSTAIPADHLNHAYLEAPQARSDEIDLAYRRYTEGALHAWQTDPRFGALNARVAEFGYCADEFVSRGGWPYRLYIRIGRRMVGEYVMNENDATQNGRRPPIGDPVGFGLYALDTHAHQYFAAPMDWPNGERKDAVVQEGIVFEAVPDDAPYPIAYRSLTPRAADATNLLNPVTLSATNIAYSSIRMEPTFLMLGEAAGTAAALAVDAGVTVQAVSYAALRERLEANGQRVTR